MTQSAENQIEHVLSDDEKAALAGETFRHRAFVGIDFERADLRGARFESTSFVCCSLANADLRGTHFIVCDLSSVVLTGALLGEGNRFDGSTLLDPVGITEATKALIERNGGTFLHAFASRR